MTFVPKMQNEFIQRSITTLLGGAIFFGTYIWVPQAFTLLLAVILLFIIIYEWPALFPKIGLGFWLLMPLYPIFPMACLLYLHVCYYDINKFIPIYPFIAAWSYDIGAFLTGRLCGRHKICPRISPGKSWEGLFGGFCTMLLINIIIFGTEHGILFAVLCSVILTLLAFGGDLFVSYLKRRVNLKDAGNLLPGHGGLLDRFDSVFFIAVGVALFFLIGEVEVDYLWACLLHEM